VASLRRPEFHHGMIEMVCIEGTKVYVYAQTLGTRDVVGHNMGTQRVYDYGFQKSEIQPKLIKVGSEVYNQLCGVYTVMHPANQDFRPLTLEVDDDDEGIEIQP